jgi:5-(carboxyamino)imidazole ribonucleotide synthase
MNSTKKYKIGILGAGQLGTFLAQSCEKKIDNWCIFYEKEDDPGYLKYKSHAIKLHSESKKRLKQLNNCEYIILENEFYSYEELNQVNSKFIPSIDNYKNFYGKVSQRKFYTGLGLNSPKYWIVSDVSELDNIDIFPVIMKRNLLSYDGNGNRVCNNRSELHRYAVELGLPLLIEEKLELKTEFAVGIVASKNDTLILPLTETFQKDHICHFVLSPFVLENKIQALLEIEIEKLKKANLFGFFAFEFFITHDNQLYINEGAARPHNSMHISMNLIDHSQFDYIINLAINDSHIEKYNYRADMGAMINLLGKKNCTNPKLSLGEIPTSLPHEIFMYGKTLGRIGRKLGHINLLNSTLPKTEFTKILDRIYEEYLL